MYLTSKSGTNHIHTPHPEHPVATRSRLHPAVLYNSSSEQADRYTATAAFARDVSRLATVSLWVLGLHLQSYTIQRLRYAYGIPGPVCFRRRTWRIQDGSKARQGVVVFLE